MRDDCPHLKSDAHDGYWIMSCRVKAKECGCGEYHPCNSDYDEYKTCHTYQWNERNNL